MSENKWFDVLIKYKETGKLEPCPYCAGKIEVIKLEIGRGSVSFICQECKKIGHFDMK